MKESLKVVLTFDFVREILWFDHSNKPSSAVLSHGTIYFYYVTVVLTFEPKYGYIHISREEMAQFTIVEQLHRKVL